MESTPTNTAVPADPETPQKPGAVKRRITVEIVGTGEYEKMAKLAKRLCNTPDPFIPEECMVKCRGVREIYNNMQACLEESGICFGGLPVLNRKQAMRGAIITTVCCTVKYCYQEMLFNQCSGCVLDIGNQYGHSCVNWSDSDHNEAMHYVCQKISTDPMLTVLLMMASALACLKLKQKHINKLNAYVDMLRDSEEPLQELGMLQKEMPENYERLGDVIVNNKFTDFKALLTYCAKCAPNNRRYERNDNIHC